MRLYILSILLLWLISCESSKDTFYDLHKAKELKSNKILYETSEAGVLTQLKIKDSLLIAIDDIGEQKIILINLNTRKEILKFGEKGRGPNEFLSPKFIINSNAINNDSACILIYDNNLLRFFDIDLNKLLKNKDYRIPHKNFPTKIIDATNLSVIDNKIIGKSSSLKDLGMFFIYDINRDEERWIEYYPNIKNIKPGGYNYIFNTNLVTDESTNYVICGMSFMDIISIYDSTGTHLKSHKFSENVIPDIDLNVGMVKPQSSVYFTKVFAGKDFCYFLRLGYYTGNIENRKNGGHLIKLNWHGDIIESYKLDKFLYGFCIDENKNKLLGIFSEDSDIFKILEYDL